MFPGGWCLLTCFQWTDSVIAVQALFSIFFVVQYTDGGALSVLSAHLAFNLCLFTTGTTILTGLLTTALTVPISPQKTWL